MTKKAENKETLACGVSQEQLDAWKAESKVHLVSVKTDSGVCNGYFRKPDLQVIGAASKFAASDPVRSGLQAIQRCEKLTK